MDWWLWNKGPFGKLWWIHRSFFYFLFQWMLSDANAISVGHIFSYHGDGRPQVPLWVFLIQTFCYVIAIILNIVLLRSHYSHHKLYINDLNSKLTLILLEPKLISLCHQYRACMPVQSDQALLLLADHLQVLVLISIKIIMDSSKNGRWIIPFMKFSRLRVNQKLLLTICLTALWWLKEQLPFFLLINIIKGFF